VTVIKNLQNSDLSNTGVFWLIYWGFVDLSKGVCLIPVWIIRLKNNSKELLVFSIYLTGFLMPIWVIRLKIILGRIELCHPFQRVTHKLFFNPTQFSAHRIITPEFFRFSRLIPLN
jgi:hypothetical protein